MNYNAYRLDFPPQLGIHDVINVQNLKLYEPPLSEEELQVLSPTDNITDFLPPFAEGTLLDVRTRSTRQQHHSYLVRHKGKLPTQAKWFSQAAFQAQFSHLVENVGTLSISTGRR